jgi:N-acetylglucosamine kinase-like BadF-type ATPase
MQFLGVDVGGSRCRYAWWPEGRLPGGEAPAAVPTVHGVTAAAAALAAALRAAAQQAVPTAAVCAVAGVGDRNTSMALLDAVRGHGIAFPLAIVGDVLAAAAAALGDGPALLVWSGTGSFALARGRDGALHRVGGRGYLLGDQGSGFDLVRRAAAAALLAVDGLGPATALGPALAEAFAAPAVERLGAALQGLSSGAVAGQLPVVLQAAAAGDAVANEVLDAGAAALAGLALAAARTAGLEPGAPVAFGGGVLVGAPAVRERLAARLAGFGAAPGRLVGADAGSRGAARLAHDAYHGLEPATTWVARVAV